MVHDLYCCTHAKCRRSLNGNCVFCIYHSYYAISKYMTTRHVLRCKQHALVPSCIQSLITQDMFQCITRGVWSFLILVRPGLLTNGNFKVTQPIYKEAWLTLSMPCIQARCAGIIFGNGIHVIVIKGITIAITKPKRSYITFKALVYQLHECALKLFYLPNYV